MLTGKTAIITGTNRGIGAETLRLFAKNGASIIFAHSRQASESFEESCSQLAQTYGTQVIPIYFDLTDEGAIKSAFKELRSITKTIDILVNNAGVSHGGLMQMTSTSDLRNVIDQNYIAQVLISQYSVKLMMRNKSGSIVNISSIAGLDGKNGTIAYGASKSALSLATHTMASELSAYNIRVNCVAPGVVDTEMLSEMDEKAKEELLASNFMRRLGRVDEIASVVLFLASSQSSYLNAQTLRVDGGM